jgi:hypothetical protein
MVSVAGNERGPAWIAMPEHYVHQVGVAEVVTSMAARSAAGQTERER